MRKRTRIAQKHAEVFKGKDGQFYYRERAANGRILSVSEGYTRRHDAKRGAKRNTNLPVRVAA